MLFTIQDSKLNDIEGEFPVVLEIEDAVGQVLRGNFTLTVYSRQNDTSGEEETSQDEGSVFEVTEDQ